MIEGAAGVPAYAAAMGLVATVMDGPLGPLRLVASGWGLRSVRFDPGRWPVEPSEDAAEDAPRGASPVLDAACDLLEARFAGQEVELAIPLDLRGLTDFQRRVVDAMAAIPYGGLATYGALARAIGQPSAARAVGGVCNSNPVPIVVPCHRVIASDGSLGGYAAGTAAKRLLLELERGAGAVPLGGWEPRAATRRGRDDAPTLF